MKPLNDHRICFLEGRYVEIRRTGQQNRRAPVRRKMRIPFRLILAFNANAYIYSSSINIVPITVALPLAASV